jgi:hypothetical protein
LKNLRSRFDRFCFRNRDKGIPNLMLYISVGTAIVYLISQVSGNYSLYSMLLFDRSLILRGQVWRLFTYALTYGAGNTNLLLIAISLFCYYTLGRAMEMSWGTFRFNLFYFTGMVLMDIYCLIFGGHAHVTYLNLSLFLGYATMYPESGFLLFFIIPVKAWLFGLIDLAIVLLDFLTLSFPANLFSIISLANYFLFFGSDVVNLLPRSWRIRMQQKLHKTPKPQGHKVITFRTDAPREAPKPDYNHRCTICGRTDVSHPDLEFRYCSRCNGYHCYCEDHINNHVHIE